MANAVCLLFFFCLAGLSAARQVPKECSKGPEVWCQSLKVASDCGAVGHCIASVWQTEEVPITSNQVSDKIVRLFRQLKDVKDLINEDYLATRVSSACRDVPSPAVTAICKANTAHLEQYLQNVLASDTSAETLCRIIGMCNNDKLEALLQKKKPEEQSKPKTELLGASRCTWGPSYWCSNISTSHECKAIHHCVKRVWPKMNFPKDTDGICQICTDMVRQARDQLQSNETQEELKEVFEGSCKLIPIKIVRSECIKLSDDFVPELVETLASQMNPQAVCSVAGLCNNAAVDRMLDNYYEISRKRGECTDCMRTVRVTRKRFDDTSYDDFLVGMLKVCRNMGSLSDSCSMLVFKYYENIRAAVQQDLTPRSVCHVSGQCSDVFWHKHDLYYFGDENMTLYQQFDDDIPCEFCEQIVNHLRDTLIANTTEIEFKKILIGLCKQTGEFKSECLSLVEQYDSTIYHYLVEGLNGTELCGYVGLCGKNKTRVPVMPMVIVDPPIYKTFLPSITPGPNVPEEVLARFHESQYDDVKIMGTEAPSPQPQLPQPQQPQQPQQLPVERMFLAAPQSPAMCSFCQYFLHYVQVELSDERTEEAIRKTVENACEVLPESVNSECRQFVTQYGPAVIALLVQEIDPASVCPAIGMCPASVEVHRVDINVGKSNCPLCLFAVEQLEAMLKNNRSVENIRHALDNLCNHLSSKLRTECVDFVAAYTEQLVDMLVADMDAQEICVYLKLCADNVPDPLKITHHSVSVEQKRKPDHSLKTVVDMSRGDIETNEIPDRTVNGRPVAMSSKPKTVCIICEFVMKEIDDQIKDKHNDDEIKNIVRGVCKRMPKSVRSECDQFVAKYADLVISLLAQELDPKEVCQEMKLCPPENIQAVKEEILDCAVCETVVMAVKKVLNNDKVDRNIVHIVEKSCKLLPAKYYDRCNTLMEIYGEGIIHLIEDYGTKGVCQKIGMCAERHRGKVNLYRETRH